MSAFIIRVEKKRMNVFDSIKKNRLIVGSIFEIFLRCFVFVEAILNNIFYFWWLVCIHVWYMFLNFNWNEIVWKLGKKLDNIW